MGPRLLEAASFSLNHTPIVRPYVQLTQQPQQRVKLLLCHGRFLLTGETDGLSG